MMAQLKKTTWPTWRSKAARNRYEPITALSVVWICGRETMSFDPEVVAAA